MNRKTKKRITTIVILLFFLTAGGWYFFQTGETREKQEDGAELSGIYSVAATEYPAVQQPEQNVPENENADFPELVVYVCGAVKTPGVYTLAAGSRLYEAVILAGGFSAEADPAYHNLARNITDGERIYILSCAETALLTTQQQVNGEEGAGSVTADANTSINLNTATAEQLMELPGIGEARAADILEYRARIGQFTAIEEIMNVSGIGEAMFERIKDKITVK